MITTLRELCRAFWDEHPECTARRRPGDQNKQVADVRIVFCDWVDMLAKSGEISESLAQRATL